MEFKKACPDDLQRINEIYEGARAFMIKSANPDQWKNNYPSEALILEDMEKGELYLAFDEGEICAVFVFTEGEDETYGYIEGGWLSDRTYRAVHRVASSGKKKGMIKAIMDFCFSHCDNIRIDTHRDNKIMQRALLRYGFKECGIIYLSDKSERIAYQLEK